MTGLFACQPAPAPSARVSTVARAKVTYDVEIASVRSSVHGKLDCSECHAASEKPLARAPLTSGETSCATCHAAAVTSHADGVHARMPDGGRAAGCPDCHGAHDIYPSSDPRSRTHKLRIPITCGRCHQNPELARHLGMRPSEAAQHYAESIHGRALLRGGLIVAPSCIDCHLGHDLQRSQDRRSSVNPRNVTTTCGKCHEGIARRLARGAHHGPTEKGAEGHAVSCVDCHSSHTIEPPLREYKLATDRRCGACHQAEFATHLDTYHGRAHALGAADVAACYDCHGHHEILPASNPASPVSPNNKASTCKKCHTNASHHLTEYLAHGDRKDRERYPALHFVYTAMTALLAALLGIFSVHALCWSGRILLEYLRNPVDFREKRSRRRQRNLRVGQFGLTGIHRFSYLVLLLSVALLVVTGLPLKAPLSDWSQKVFRWLGGASTARELHRAGAILALVAVIVHLAQLSRALWRRRAELRDGSGEVRLSRVLALATGPTSPWPGILDLRGLWAHTRWFVGRGPEPVFGRFTYWEKLDYVAATLVFAVLAATGISLWFPEITVLFVPGYFLNIAQLIHSDEAVLAVGSAFTYHVLHVFVLGRLLVPERRLEGESGKPEGSGP